MEPCRAHQVGNTLPRANCFVARRRVSHYMSDRSQERRPEVVGAFGFLSHTGDVADDGGDGSKGGNGNMRNY